MMGNRRTRKRIWITLTTVIILGGGAFFLIYSQSSDDEVQEDPHVVAEVGTVIEKALAVGTIEPDNEIEVKSKISGVVNKIYAQPGDFVREGEPLIEVRPDPTPLELAEAKRSLERTESEKENLSREMDRMRTLLESNLVSQAEFEQLEQQFDDVHIRLQINQERLQLLETGRITMGDVLIESVIRAPIDGYILEKMVDVGEPVVPLTSYQAGTALMSIAGMDQLLFKGTVDEIDVGKMTEGMRAEIKIGAVPGSLVYGEVSRISLKATTEENATVFPVEIAITDPNNVILRAGYSANADIIIEQMADVVTIPERVITIRDGRSYVEIPGVQPGSREEVEIETGLSDAITIAILDGVKEGDKILEKPERELVIR